MLRAGRFAWILAVAVAWTVLSSSRTEAQDCVICSDVQVDGQLGHIATDSPNHGIHDRGRGDPP